MYKHNLSLFVRAMLLLPLQKSDQKSDISEISDIFKPVFRLAQCFYHLNTGIPTFQNLNDSGVMVFSIWMVTVFVCRGFKEFFLNLTIILLFDRLVEPDEDPSLWQPPGHYPHIPVF